MERKVEEICLYGFIGLGGMKTHKHTGCPNTARCKEERKLRKKKHNKESRQSFLLCGFFLCGNGSKSQEQRKEQQIRRGAKEKVISEGSRGWKKK